jgi:hypothetical protein
MKPRTAPVYTSETLETIAASFEKTLAELAADIYNVAFYIDDELANRGARIIQLQHADPPLPTYFLTEAAFAAYDHILFFRREEGDWMCRKNPRWQSTWLHRYGATDPKLAEAIKRWIAEQDEIKRREEEEALRVKRENERFVQGQFEDFSTDQIAERMTLVSLLSRRCLRGSISAPRKHKDNLVAYLRSIYEAEYRLMREDLYYRSEMGDDRARMLLARGTRYYFTDEEEAALMESNDPIVVPQDKRPAPPKKSRKRKTAESVE